MNRTRLKKAVFSFLLPVICLCLLFGIKQIYPFGPRSNMHSDMHIQYIDFFAYLKDVLEGKASAEYSFSLSLGSSVSALMGYYLLSPFSLLVVFFEKSQLQLFFFLITALKVGCCGLTFCFMLDQRFSLSSLCSVMLSAAYAFTQYVVGQMTNIMWLDGVMMLPVMMAGVYRFIEKEKPALLYFSVALSIVFNWYTAYINCLFIVLYYLLETAWRPFSLRTECKKFFRFLTVEALGVCLSCAVFLPVVLNQMQGRSIDINLSSIMALNGEWWDFIYAFMLGSSFPSREITFFCSVLALLFFFAFFFSRFISKKEKLFAVAFVLILYLSFWLMPLEFIWNGFLKAGSYAYRHLYITTAGILLIAARAIHVQENNHHPTLPVLISGGVMAVLSLASFLGRDVDPKLLSLQLVLIIGYCVAYCVLHRRSFRSLSTVANRFSCGLIAVLFCLELTVNAVCVADDMYGHSAQEFIDYSRNQQALVADIQNSDESVYRMEQTLSRDQRTDHHTFYANESLAYGYRGLQTYTSCYEASTADLLIRMGYNTSYFPSFYHDPLLASDSFLGVKYLLSEKSYIGYQAQDIGSRNGKTVYLNPYALPLAFSAQRTDPEAITSGPFSSNENPFEYINELYSAVLGRKIQVYQPLPCSQTEEANGSRCLIAASEALPANAPAYVSFIGFNLHDSSLIINGIAQPYNLETWAEADHVAYLGNAAELKEVAIENGDCYEMLLYYLDLDAFADIVNEIRAKQAQLIQMEKNTVKAVYHAKAGETLLFTIPYSKGWKATVNGTQTDVIHALQNFVAIQMQEGENEIVLQYSSPGKNAGLLLSLLSIAGFLLFLHFSKRRPNTAREKQIIH